ncbi:CPBP family intramembrane glutamic endopeptidase [Fodinicurvata fenggangensis]|uniref:CPBP family intramembrane glutamic endopeptidase n=1 Tax=Fodinicurvata fenggangensis TaxID=1121830 RepID=UPI00138DD5A9|nr:type II CAAX endopeptidase family protein [Fodinicurvata fenggangensis]
MEPQLQLVLVGFLLQSLVILLVLFLVIILRRGLSLKALGFVPSSQSWILRGVLLAIAAIPAVAVVNIIVSSFKGAPLENPQMDLLNPGELSAGPVLLTLFAAGLVAPIVEEVVFRGFFYGWLRTRYGQALSMVVSAGLFSLLHGIAILIPALFVVGLMLSWIYEKSKSLWPAIVMHSAFNCIMLGLLYMALFSGAA